MCYAIRIMKLDWLTGSRRPRALVSSVALTALVGATGAAAGADAGALSRAAEQLYVQGRYVEAESTARQAIDAAQTEDPRGLGVAAGQRQLAQALRELGRFKDAQRAAQEALALSDAQGEAGAAEAAAARLEGARVQIELGSYSEALTSAQQVVKARDQGDADVAGVAAALTVAAEAERNLGDFAQALPLVQRALKLAERADANAPATADTLNTLGLIYMGLRDYDEARRLHQQALHLREQGLGANHPSTAESALNLGAVAWATRQFDEAETLMKRALQIREQSLPADHPRLASTLNNLAELYRSTGRAAEAVPLWQRALAIAERGLGPDHPYTNATRSNLAGYYWTNGQLDKAAPLLEQAEAAWEKSLGPDHPETARALNLLAALAQSRGKDDQALALYRRGLAADDHNLANVFAVTSEDQKLRFLEKTQGHYLAALSLIQRRFANDPEAVRFGLELVLRRKGIVLDAQSRVQEALEGRLQGETLTSWRRLAQYRGDLAKLLLAGPSSFAPEAYQQQVEALQGRIAEVERHLSESSGIAAAELAQREVTAARVAARLPANSVLAEFVLVPDWSPTRVAWEATAHYLAFVLTPLGQIHLVNLGDRDRINAAIETALGAVNDSKALATDRAAYTAHSGQELAALYQLLLGGVAAAVGDYGEVLLSPDGELHKVPMSALQLPNGHYLVEDHVVTYLTSGRDLLREASRTAPGAPLLVVANPAFGSKKGLGSGTDKRPVLRAVNYRGLSFDSLQGAAEEARTISPLFTGGPLILDLDKATESAVRAAKAPRVLHFATHGFFLPDIESTRPPSGPLDAQRGGGSLYTGGTANPMVRSGLALAGANYASSVTNGDDGILTALEVSSMDLHGTELVTLSACETAAGEVHVGEGVYGLRRAFVLAGARNLLMTLWNVRDRVAAEQMQHFYEGYRRGATPAAALRDAQIETIQHLRTLLDGSAPVRIWAPFILQQAGL
jgi:CHAT domain-containing protein/Tfp pilus assembly protein PilF